MFLESAELAALERRYRAALINGITGYKPANLIGTVDRDGRSNLAIMSSLVHLGSNPPLLALVMRPDSVPRHTLDNILATGHYTVNHVAGAFIERAHQTAARYPREVSEFAAVGLVEHWREGFPAPFVAEASVRLGMALRDHQPLAINGTHLVIGEVLSLDVPDACVQEDGSVDLAVADTVALAGLDRYYRPRDPKRMAYARPDQPPRVVDAAAGD
jgi:flavin reductase (DIM6/NTAB) family NADH-FMN oxidoreductase RutF